MEKQLKYKLFHLFFQVIFIILKNIIYVKCICNRDMPINNNGKCKSIYCTKNDFENNICSIDNEIIKTQWLNNFINFNEYRFRFTGMVINDNEELILETSPEETNGQRLFFRLTKDGRSYYKNNDNEEILTRSILVLDDDKNGVMRYESQIFLIKRNNNNLDGNKQFLVSISLYYGYMEIYDLDDNNISCSKIGASEFGNYIIFSKRGSIIELNNKEYIYIFIGQILSDMSYRNYYLVLEKYIFYDTNINKRNLNNSFLIEDIKSIKVCYSRIVNALKTISNNIILFYLTSNLDYKVEVLNQELEIQSEKYFEKIKNVYSEISIFFKCINLKENIIIFAYYKDKNNNTLQLFVENIEENNKNLTNMFSFELNEYKFNNDINLNDLIKINNKRFSFVSTSFDNLELYIVLFDLYNNDNNIKLRFYKIDIFKLYNYKIFREISAIIYNSCLTLSFSACNTNECDQNSNFFTTLLILSYINGSDYNINITSYFSNQENTNSDDIYLKFPNNFTIDNNIFGYQIMQNIKIISIPQEINLYKIEDDNKKTKIKIGDEYTPNIKLMISPKNDVIRNYTIYFVEYQYQYSDPDYDTFNEYPNIIYDYPKNPTVNQKEEFNNDRKTYFGRSLKINFKLCNEKCKTCKTIGKSDTVTKCEECKDNLKYYKDSITNEYNCFSSEKDCPINFPFLKKNNNYKCESSCDFEDFVNNECILDNSSTESLIRVYKIFSDIISTLYNNEDIVINTDDDLAFHLSNTLNEKNRLNKGINNYNLSIIDLGECEAKIKAANGISQDIPLIIFKVDTYYENTTIKNVQYQIYNPVSKTKITDMSPCDEEKINIYVPTSLDNDTFNKYEELKKQGYDIFNANDSFYNDICSKFTSINNTDITLNDRKELYYDGNQIFCQENCEYKGIVIETKHAKCECSATSNTEIIFEKKSFTGIEIITSFYEVIKFSNFLVLKCFKLFFSSAGIKNNFGFVIMIIFIIFLFINLIIFLFTGMKKVREQMSMMIFCTINKTNNFPILKKKAQFENLKKTIFLSNPKKKKVRKKIIKKRENSQKIINKTPNKSKSNNITEYMRKNTSSWALNSKKGVSSFLSKKRKTKANSPSTALNKKHSKKGIGPKYAEYELDDLEYIEALRYDKRTFFEFFCCLVKREHLIVFTFIFCSDLNLLCIKLSLFVFSISLDFSTNVLFFTDESMHKIFLDYGKYNFIQQIPQIIYSTVISELFDVFLKFLSLSEKEIYETKKCNNMKKAANEVKKLIKRIKIKFFLFFLVCFVLMSFFCYFISCFCAVYENTQIILFNDSAFSFLISLIYPFVLYLIPATLRFIALRSKTKDKRFLYKISNIFPLF